MAAVDEAERRLECLLHDFRAEARTHPDLRHTLIVHASQDSAWMRWVPCDEALTSFGRRREWIGLGWTDSSFGVRGVFHARHSSSASAASIRRYMAEATSVVRMVSPVEDEHLKSLAWWMLDLYRTAWAGGRLHASPSVWSQGREVPLWVYGAVRAGAALEPPWLVFRRAADALQPPPTTWYATLSHDVFTACAEKIVLLLGSLRDTFVAWRDAEWFTRNSTCLSANRLAKARESPRSGLMARRKGRFWQYEVQSVCRYEPRVRDDLMKALRAEGGLAEIGKSEGI